MMMTGHVTRDIFERYNIVDESDLSEAAATKLEVFSAEQKGTDEGTVRNFKRVSKL
jgi:hypothetical protein